MKKDNNKYWTSFEIKVSHISDNSQVTNWRCKKVKSDKRILINEIEYNYIKKKLKQEYGIESEFNELDNEVKRILKKGIK